MNYISLHLRSALGLGLLALVAGCADDARAPSTASDDLSDQELHFTSSTLPPFRDLRLDTAPDASMVASYVDVEDNLVVARSKDHGVHWTTMSTIRHVGRGARIVAAPSNANVLYLTRVGYYSWGGAPADPKQPGDLEGLFLRSEDGGKTWQNRTASLPAVSQGLGFDTLDINPTNDQHLVTANCEGVQKSLDGGQSWSAIPGSKQALGDCNSSDLFRGINDRKTIYTLSSVGEGGGSVMMRSIDDGATWQVAAMNVDADYMIGLRGLVVHPDDARHVYLTDMNGFYSSANGGDQFHQHTRNLGADPSNVAVNPSNGALYISAGDTIYRWTPGAEPQNGHWSAVAQIPNARLGEPKIADGNLYVTTDTQLLIAPL
ncbi:MAG: sialidase family protein [Labilithrix sp.]